MSDKIKLEKILEDEGYNVEVEYNFQSKHIRVNDKVLIVIYKKDLFIEYKTKSYSIPVNDKSVDFVSRTLKEVFSKKQNIKETRR